MSSSKALQEYADNYISVTRYHYQSLQQELKEAREIIQMVIVLMSGAPTCAPVTDGLILKIARAFFEKYPEKGMK